MTHEAFLAVTDASFEAAIDVDTVATTVVDFWSSSCLPCKQVEHVLASIAPDLPVGVRIVTVSTDHNPELVDRFDVRSVPTVLILSGREIRTRFTGVERPQVLRRAILDAAPDPG